MAPVLEDGVYIIKNADTDLYITLGGDPIPYVPVQGNELTKEPNQKWELRTVNNVNEYIIRNSTGEIFIGLGLARIYPPQIAGSPVPVPWSIEPVNEGVFRIAFLYQDGVITLPRPTPGTQLNLPPWQGDEKQKWTFEKQ
jgi:hypothetical protein